MVAVGIAKDDHVLAVCGKAPDVRRAWNDETSSRGANCDAVHSVCLASKLRVAGPFTGYPLTVGRDEKVAQARDYPRLAGRWVKAEHCGDVVPDHEQVWLDPEFTFAARAVRTRRLVHAATQCRAVRHAPAVVDVAEVERVAVAVRQQPATIRRMTGLEHLARLVELACLRRNRASRRSRTCIAPAASRNNDG